MAKRRVKITEKLSLQPNGTVRYIWVVSCNGQSQVYYTKKEARAAKAAIEKGA